MLRGLGLEEGGRREVGVTQLTSFLCPFNLSWDRQYPVEQFTQIIYVVPLIYSQNPVIRWFSMVRESRLERKLEIWSTCEVHLA